MVLYPSPDKTTYTIGGKAKGLYQLRQAGITVPGFMVLPAENFDGLIDGNDFSNETARQRLLSYAPAAADKKRIIEILQHWGFPRQPVVVRSSIADEDGKEHAFAGLMHTYLNLTQTEDVFTAIASCAASAFSERAVAYRKEKGLSLKPKPAVIVQQQIEPDVSGVLFSTFPEYPQEMAVHAVWGFGEGLVSGALEADEFYLLKKDGRLNREKIAIKEKCFTRNTVKGIKETDVSIEKQTIGCLKSTELAQLYTLATELEKRFSTPLDIEFCIQNGTIYFLQARPITQPIPEVVVYDNSNIQESYCGVTTPLTFSFAQRAYATVYRQTMHLILLPEKTIQAHEPVVTNLLGLVKGRIYYNINNWYRGLQLLPSFRQNKEDMERMMGVEEPVDFVTDRSKNLVEKISMLPSLMLNLLRLLKAFSQLKTSVPRFHAHFQQYYQRFYALPLADMPVEELYKEKELLDRELLHNWTTPIINDFYVMMMNGRVRRKLKKAGIANTDEFLSRYLSGDQQIESAQPAIQLQQLAVSAQSYEGLKKLILQLPGDVHQQVALRFPPFYKEVQVFIDQYGDRTMGELKLETVTMRIEPLIFYKYLKNYLSAEDITLPQSGTRLQQAARTELENALKQHTPFFRKSLFRDLEKLQQAIRFREGMRLERTRLFGMYRSVYLAIGEGLVGMGILKSSRAVFYLTEEEILNTKKHNAAALVQGRAAEFEAYRKEEVPSRVVIPSPPPEKNNEQRQESGLQGTGCFAGIVSGEVVLVTGPEDAIDLNGKILCALRTDPGWVSLFPTCKAVLIEKGSSLSHSVILLREFGIPSIINIPRLTKTLKNGQFITINGTTGAIKIAENGNS